MMCNEDIEELKKYFVTREEYISPPCHRTRIDELPAGDFVVCSVDPSMRLMPRCKTCTLYR